MLKKIKSLVEFVYETIPLYRKLYQDKPDLKSIADFKNLPCLTIGDFAQCCIEDVLSGFDEAISVLPPIENKSIFPFPRLESASDRDIRYQIFYFLMDHAGISDDASFLIITDASHSYFFGEIANNLLYYKHPAWIMILRDQSFEEIHAWVDRLEPDCLFLGTDRILDKACNLGVPYIWTINQYDRDLSSDSIKHFDIYAISEISWIGIRCPGEPYIYPCEFFYLESDHEILVLTTLENDLQPFIRYKTSDRGQVLKDNLFRINYIGEH